MTTLVLVPGLLCDEALWAPQVAALRGEADIRIADVTGADSLGVLADAVLASADGPFALAGLSMGGYVAFEVLRRAPERVQRVALLATSARPDDPAKRAERLAVIALAQAGDFAAALERLVPSWMGADAPADPALLAELEAMALRIGPEAFVRQERALLGRADSRPTLAAITCPALVLCGRQDLRTPVERSAEIAAGIPGARLVVVEDCGHIATLEQPAAVSAALRSWLHTAASPAA